MQECQRSARWAALPDGQCRTGRIPLAALNVAIPGVHVRVASALLERTETVFQTCRWRQSRAFEMFVDSVVQGYAEERISTGCLFLLRIANLRAKRSQSHGALSCDDKPKNLGGADLHFEAAALWRQLEMGCDLFNGARRAMQRVNRLGNFNALIQVLIRENNVGKFTAGLSLLRRF